MSSIPTTWPPHPREVRQYNISMLRKTVLIRGIPPCMWCGAPVYAVSMDGPLVCPLCDMGKSYVRHLRVDRRSECLKARVRVWELCNQLGKPYPGFPRPDTLG